MKIINSLPQKKEIEQQMGSLLNLKTAIKDNLVNAINCLHDNLISKLGTTDISAIGNGTVTSAISKLDTDLTDSIRKFNNLNASFGTIVTAVDKDIFEVALETSSFVTVIYTNISTKNIPKGFEYGLGLVFRRAADQCWIILFGYNRNDIAVNCYLTTGDWIGWRIV